MDNQTFNFYSAKFYVLHFHIVECFILIYQNMIFFARFVVYDVTRRETFTNLSDVWAKEVDLHSINQDCVKMLVGNKVDRVSFAFYAKKLVPD